MKEINPITIQLMSDNQNWYHTIHHVKNMRNTFIKYKEDFIKEFPGLDDNQICDTIDFHDIIYNPGFNTNEQSSADLYKCTHYNNFDISVYNAIVNTNPYMFISITDHYWNVLPDLQQVIHDLDWFGFAMDYKDFNNQNKQIINEAVEKGNFEFEFVKENRINFLENIKDKNIFWTQTFINKGFNEIAKENIHKLLCEM